MLLLGSAWRSRIAALSLSPLLEHVGEPARRQLHDALVTVPSESRLEEVPVWKLEWRRLPGIPLSLDYAVRPCQKRQRDREPEGVRGL